MIKTNADYFKLLSIKKVKRLYIPLDEVYNSWEKDKIMYTSYTFAEYIDYLSSLGEYVIAKIW